MKINYYTKATVFFLLFTMASPAIASAAPSNPATTESRTAYLQNRLAEIQSMNKPELSQLERRTLRREVKEIKKELATISGGVYLSIGAIILIALLLILLL
ncbi:MAG TPA: hypothetical protein VIQ51_18080 [Chryseosolibacter sp.]